jgi:cell division protein FtsB
MFGNKSFNQIKTALIKSGKIEADATDQEVAQAAIDFIGVAQSLTTQNTEGDKKEEAKADDKKSDDKKETTEGDKKEEKTEQTDLTAQISALQKDNQGLTARVLKLENDVQTLAKGEQKSSIDGEKGSKGSEEQNKLRAYMSNPINKGVNLQKSNKTSKIPLIEDDEEEVDV